MRAAIGLPPAPNRKTPAMTMVQQPFDRERVANACFADLDLALVMQTMHQGSETRRYAGPLDPRTYWTWPHDMGSSASSVIRSTTQPNRVYYQVS